jgi:hypothetical protein
MTAAYIALAGVLALLAVDLAICLTVIYKPEWFNEVTEIL